MGRARLDGGDRVRLPRPGGRTGLQDEESALNSSAPPGRGLCELLGIDEARLRTVLGLLKERQLTVAAAESLTGGLFTALLTEIPGSSAVVRGALVVYATDLKHSLADVDAELLAGRGPVDPDVAIALARGARTRCGASIGVGLTGVAGPDPQGTAAVGTFFVAVAGPGHHRVLAQAGRPEDHAAGGPHADDLGGRSRVRAAAVRAAVDLLAELAAETFGNTHDSADVSPTADTRLPGSVRAAE